MVKTGTLEVKLGESKLNGTPLAREGAADPLAAATNFLANRGLGDDDRVKVTGSAGSLGTLEVFFITDVESAPLRLVVSADAVELTARMRSTAAKRAASAGAKRSRAKGSAPSKRAAAAKNTSVKSSRGKKATAKKAAKKAAKKMAVKRARKGEKNET
jgi:hypothetical protein